MKYSFKKTITITTACLLSIGSTHAQKLDSVNFIADPAQPTELIKDFRQADFSFVEHLTSSVDLQAPISSHLPSGPSPHKINLWDAGNGNNLALLDSWAVSSFAGGTNPIGTAFNVVQSGMSYGGTSAHLGNGQVGFFLNGSSSGTSFQNSQKYWSMSFGNTPRNSHVRPWGGSSDFHYGYKQEFKNINMHPDSCGYTYVGMFLKDTTTNKEIAVVILDWDSRAFSNTSDSADFAEVNDANGNLTNIIPFINATLGNSNIIENYGTPFNRGNIAGSTIQRFGTITQQNMLNLISLFKSLAQRAPQYDAMASAELAQNGNTQNYRHYIALANSLRAVPSMSNNPGDYVISKLGVQAELANTTNTWTEYAKSLLGVTYKDVNFTTWNN